MSDYWKDNNIEKPEQIIVCAAVKYNDLIICGARHYDKVMRTQMNNIDKKYLNTKDCVQGFIDQFGDFLTREQAMKIVKENKQTLTDECCHDDDVLFSENLY